MYGQSYGIALIFILNVYTIPLLLGIFSDIRLNSTAQIPFTNVYTISSNVKTFAVSVWSYIKTKRIYGQIYGIVCTRTCNVSTKLSTLLSSPSNLQTCGIYKVIQLHLHLFRIYLQYSMTKVFNYWCSGSVSTFVHNVNTLILLGRS